MGGKHSLGTTDIYIVIVTFLIHRVKTLENEIENFHKLFRLRFEISKIRGARFNLDKRMKFEFEFSLEPFSNLATVFFSKNRRINNRRRTEPAKPTEQTPDYLFFVVLFFLNV